MSIPANHPSTSTVRLTNPEWRFLIHAAAACTQSGGGGFSHTLFHYLAEQLGMEIDNDFVVALQQLAARELED
jgi:hypothetical protein